MKNIISLSLLFLCAAVFAGSDPEKDFVPIPANPDFAFARDLQSRGPRGNAGEKSPITKSYRLAKYPVTNAEYSAFCKATGHRTPRYWRNDNFPEGKANHPVLEVSVDDVNAYCRHMEKKYPRWHFRLPTEAEWENAAAGPKHYAFPWGNSDQVRMKDGLIVAPFNFNAVVASHYLAKSPDMKVTFFHQRSTRQGESVPLRELISVNERGQVRGWINHADYTGFVYCDLFRKLSAEGGYTSAVDAYPEGKSPYGCFDMAGNSWDWTCSEITATNGAERGRTVNAIRGGSWYANKNSCRTDFRGEGRRAQGCYNTVGFRLVVESWDSARRDPDSVSESQTSPQSDSDSVSGPRKPPKRDSDSFSESRKPPRRTSNSTNRRPPRTKKPRD